MIRSPLTILLLQWSPFCSTGLCYIGNFRIRLYNIVLSSAIACVCLCCIYQSVNIWLWRIKYVSVYDCGVSRYTNIWKWLWCIKICINIWSIAVYYNMAAYNCRAIPYVNIRWWCITKILTYVCDVGYYNILRTRFLLFFSDRPYPIIWVVVFWFCDVRPYICQLLTYVCMWLSLHVWHWHSVTYTCNVSGLWWTWYWNDINRRDGTVMYYWRANRALRISQYSNGIGNEVMPSAGADVDMLYGRTRQND